MINPGDKYKHAQSGQVYVVHCVTGFIAHLYEEKESKLVGIIFPIRISSLERSCVKVGEIND